MERKQSTVTSYYGDDEFYEYMFYVRPGYYRKLQREHSSMNFPNGILATLHHNLNESLQWLQSPNRRTC